MIFQVKLLQNMHTLCSRVKLITMNFPVIIIIDGIITCSGGRTRCSWGNPQNIGKLSHLVKRWYLI